MSAKFKLKNRENWIKFPLDRLSLDPNLMRNFLSSCPEISEDLVRTISSFVGQREYSFYLDEDQLGLALVNQKPLYIDIKTTLNYHREIYHKKGYKNEPFYKSIKSASMKVIDITCGMMSDSLLMNYWGFKVQAFEANPITSCLILNALKIHPLENFKFIPREFSWDLMDESVAFYDPFFRKDKEKTSPKKSMQVLRDFDKFSFLNRPLEIEKVVVKRPKGSDEIWEKAHHQYHGKSVRYDVYQST